MNNIGLSIQEGVALGNSPYKDPSKRNVGILLQSRRGVPNLPTRVQSLKEFYDKFGEPDPKYFGHAIVKNIFDEAGNARVTLYVSRVVSKTAPQIYGQLTASSDKIYAGYRGEKDPGVWALGMTVDIYTLSTLVEGSAVCIVKSAIGEELERFYAPSNKELFLYINKASKYITMAEPTTIVAKPLVPLTGTYTATEGDATVTNSGTADTALLIKGSTLFSGDVLIGRVESVDSVTKTVTLTSPALVSVSAQTLKIRSNAPWDTVTLSLGEGEDNVVEEDFYEGGTAISPTGLSSFDKTDIQLLLCTEFHSLSMAKEMKKYVDRVKGPIGLINLPLLANDGIASYYNSNLSSVGESYLASIAGWLTVLDNKNNEQLIPALGAWVGAGFLRTPYLNGDYIHIPPAGIDSMLTSVTDVVPRKLSSTEANNMIENSSNIISSIDNVGFYIGSSRTYSKNELFKSIHIRMQTTYYKERVLRALKFMEQKPNTPELKREALITLRTFFKEEYDRGALERSIPFETAYQGICDRSNNPTTQDRKTINIDILWIPTECVESVSISLLRNDGVLTLI